MKTIFILTITTLFLVSCGSTQKKYDKKIILNTTTQKIPKFPENPNPINNSTTKEIIFDTQEIPPRPIDAKIENIIEVARSYHGTPYRYGGMSIDGIDCSGLIYNAFKEENIALPRISREMAKKGKKITLGEVQKGDLVFFITNRNRNLINHVGLVVDVFPGKILFIHSSTSQGVIVSALDEIYWQKAFKEARRVIAI